MYSKSRNIVIGFHGCDSKTRDEIVACKSLMSKSHNDYDWLGNGLYFWENNYDRALQWAQDKMRREPHKIAAPSVLGAFIDLGYCLDLIDSKYLSALPNAFTILKDNCNRSKRPLPENNGGSDKLFRRLDCAVIETLHDFTKTMGKSEFDSVRGVFWEGNELYPGAGFMEKNHIQICLRNPNCIKGFFIPRVVDGEYTLP
jgi:hypothetical protein